MLLILVIKKMLSNSVEFEKATLGIEMDSKIDDVCLTFKLEPEFSLNATSKIDGEEVKIDKTYIRNILKLTQNQPIIIDKEPILLELVSGLKSKDKDKLLLIIIAIYSCQLTVSHFLFTQQNNSKELNSSDKKQILKFSYCVIFKFVVLLYGDTNLINYAFLNIKFENEKENENFNTYFIKIRKKVKNT